MRFWLGFSILLALLVLPGFGLLAQEAKTAADVTASGRTMDQALDGILRGGEAENPGARSLFLLIDATASLQTAGLADKLELALDRNAEHLKQTRIGVARVGLRAVVVLRPTADRKAVVKEVRRLLSKPSQNFQNVYADIRALASAFDAKTQSGAREIVLVSLENGDAEDDVEGTAAALEQAQIKCSVITQEAYLADSYWAARPYERPPRKTKLQGADGPFVDLPWGWLFQIVAVNEITPAGYAVYGLTRLAAATRGRVFLYTPEPSSRHVCAVYWSCPFCSGDHSPDSEIYRSGRTSFYAPSARPRKEVYRSLVGDPFFKAVRRAWQQASKARLIRSNPPLRLQGTSARPDRQRPGWTLDLTSSLQFERHAKKADEAAQDCARILTFLEKELESANKHKARGHPRQKAMAALTRLLLQLTKVNLVTFSGWCREMAPKLVAKNRPDPTAPEVGWPRRGERPVGIWFTNLCLCHGVEPFYQVELPGGERLRKELQRLDQMTREFMELYSNTPFTVALHRSGIARFHLTYPGIAGRRIRKRPKSKSAEDPITETARRRPRRAGTSSGGTAGPKTGKD